MVTVLVTSFLLLAAISYALYRWQRASALEEPQPALETRPRGSALFSAISPEQQAALVAADEEAERASARSALLARARQGEVKALDEAARADDAGLYDEALDALTDSAADSDARLLSLVSHIARHEGLRVNRKLAAKFLEGWKREPGHATTARMLHIVALAGDAALYGEAVEEVAERWRTGGVPGLSAAELQQLVESEYWVLPAASRSSGAGFVLKRTIAGLRRQLTMPISHQS